jgi:protein-S-isoprenylcysteine O-methyltransferase Ste14
LPLHHPSDWRFSRPSSECGLLHQGTMTVARFRASRISDWLGFAIFATWTAVTLSKMPAAGIMLAPSLLFEAAVAVSFLIRDQPRATNRSLRARASAYGGSFLVIVFTQLAGIYQPEWFTPRITPLVGPAMLLWLGGSLWTAYSVWHLRHAFSIEPAARRLVSSGPYAFARHPVYTGYVAQYLGMVITFPTIPFALVLLAWSLLIWDRMRQEETILAMAFPEYSAYRRRVGALGSWPLLGRREVPASTPDRHILLPGANLDDPPASVSSAIGR